MKIAIIGRTEVLFDTTVNLRESGHKIVCILTAKEAPEYTKTAADFRALSVSWDIPFAHSPKISEFEDFLRSTGADIGVSINYPGIIPQGIINIFPFGILNAHGGDLPKYRGNACQAWAIINGEKKIGLCIHKMVGGELDSGDIIARDYMEIDDQTKIAEVLQWMRKRTPVLITEAISRLSLDKTYILEVQSQNCNQILHCYPRNPDDGKIDWKQTAIEILHLINGCNRPYAGAFCGFNNQKMIIWDAELVMDNELFCAVPGQVTKIVDDYVEIACGKGKLRLLEIELDETITSPNKIIKSIRNRLS